MGTEDGRPGRSPDEAREPASRHDDEPLVQVSPEGGPVGSDESERELRRLYPHPRGVVRVGLIAGVDGAATHPDGTSRGLGGAADLRILRVLRAQADTVLVGGRTARRENYGAIRLPTALSSERVATGEVAAPLLVIATFTGEVPASVGPASALIMTTATSPARARLGDRWGASMVLAGERTFDLAAGLAALAERGQTRILCEGGPILAALLFKADLVDEYCLTSSPIEGGMNAPRVPPIPRAMRLAHRLESGRYGMERWVRQ